MNAPVTIALPSLVEITAAARLLLIEELTDDSDIREVAWQSMSRALADWTWENGLFEDAGFRHFGYENATDCVAALFTIAEVELMRRDAAAAAAMTDDERYMDLMAQRADARRAT